MPDPYTPAQLEAPLVEAGMDANGASYLVTHEPSSIWLALARLVLDARAEGAAELSRWSALAEECASWRARAERAEARNRGIEEVAAEYRAKLASGEKAPFVDIVHALSSDVMRLRELFTDGRQCACVPTKGALHCTRRIARCAPGVEAIVTRSTEGALTAPPRE